MLGHVGAHFTAWLQPCSRRHTKCREGDSAGLFHQRALVAHLQSHAATALGQAATSLEMGVALGLMCSVGSCPAFCLFSPWATLLRGSKLQDQRSILLGLSLATSYGLAFPQHLTRTVTEDTSSILTRRDAT